MGEELTLFKKFRNQFELLTQLFSKRSATLKPSRLERLNEIFEVSEDKWVENLKRLRNYEVKYLLIGEAHPWTDSGEVSYFYNKFNGSWSHRIWKTFYDDKIPKDAGVALRKLAEKQFLLIDSLPFAMPYTSTIRRNKYYSKLLKACSSFLLDKINHPSINWSENVRIALAFWLNGEAVIDAYPNGISLPTGQILDLNRKKISADGSGYTNPQKLRVIFGL